MSNKASIVLIAIICALQISFPAICQTGKPLKHWEEIKSAKDVCLAWPDRMKSTLKAMDLGRKGLEKVKSSFEKGDIEAACNFLLDYYKNGNTASYLRKELPLATKNRNPEADSIIRRIFVFYDIPDNVPEGKDGHLDWTWKGPDNDIEWAWGLNRHYHIRTLLGAYSETGNPEYAKAIDKDIKDWIISSLPYPGVKSSTELWRGLEVSFRAKIWANVFYRLMKSSELSPATRLLILSSIPEHAHYARNFHAQGNWLTMELSGLTTVAAAWPEFRESASWIAYSKETMIRSLQDQVYPDGVQTELTSSYHKVALDNFSLFLETCNQINVTLPGLYTDYLEKMWNYLAYTMRPDGYGLLNNDADLVNNREQVLKAAEKYSRDDWKYIGTNGKTGARPSGLPSLVFPWAGHFIMRSGYDPKAQFAFFDIGPWGTGHQHNDKLHISVSAYGLDFLVDAGRFAYRGEFAEKYGPYAKGSYGHNLVMIDGKGQGRGPSSVKSPLTSEHFRNEDSFDYAWSSFDSFTGTEGECKHTRALLYVRGKFWIVADRIDSDRPRKIETLWHWHPDCNISVNGNTVTANNEKANLKVIPVGSENLKVNIVKGVEKPSPQGWYSREYNSAVPNPVSIYSADAGNSSSFVWLLYPSDGKAPEVSAGIISKDDESVKIRVESPEGKWEVTIPWSDSKKADLKF